MKGTVSGLQNEVASLKQKIRTPDEYLQLKESEILLLEVSLQLDMKYRHYCLLYLLFE